MVYGNDLEMYPPKFGVLGLGLVRVKVRRRSACEGRREGGREGAGSAQSLLGLG